VIGCTPPPSRKGGGTSLCPQEVAGHHSATGCRERSPICLLAPPRVEDAVHPLGVSGHGGEGEAQGFSVLLHVHRSRFDCVPCLWKGGGRCTGVVLGSTEPCGQKPREMTTWRESTVLRTQKRSLTSLIKRGCVPSSPTCKTDTATCIAAARRTTTSLCSHFAPAARGEQRAENEGCTR
jgi:hypothetical protein